MSVLNIVKNLLSINFCMLETLRFAQDDIVL